ncbi:MAG TPA: nucleotidyl transferase AbiEii/AbiGii toxin family protein, partial [Candidatus Sabulitectum sp.]|nr:nucleotidyl transferase AbiEii/AbiGii toxin family protein [Candidatus Sabulitectum sp.]
MIHRIIQDRLEKEAGTSLLERARRFREIVQELSIYSLSSAGFFEKAVFHGGTELRIAHSLPRFSEDLDFMLKSPDRSFSWDSYRE